MDEVEVIKKQMVDDFKRKDGVGNPLGKIKPSEHFKNNNSIASHIIQGYEALMLDIVVRVLADNDGVSRRVNLLQHDGWTTRENSLDELAAALELIEERTGIEMSVDHDTLLPDYQS